MKIIITAGAVVIIALSVLYFTLEPVAAPDRVPDEALTSDDTSRLGNPDANPTQPVAEGKLKAANFSGTLEEVNTGCFADGECFVTVDGQHVTVLMGWSRDTVGTIIGAPSIGDLESMIGSTIEVYAQDTSDGKYTLYGSENFYIKVTSDSTGTTIPTESVSSNTCVVGGCSSQLCIDPNQDPGVSTCEYREIYACYQTAECTRQNTGKCGWTETTELKACLTTEG